MSLAAVRGEIRVFRQRSVAAAVFHFAWMGAIHVAAFAGALALSSAPARALLGVVAGVTAGGLFMVGHDACHGSFTQIPWLNRLLGRLAFLPTYHPYSLWALSHNRVHHVYTNLKGKDFVWTPASKPEFDAWPWWRRSFYRACRTPIGLLLYYPLDLWRDRLFFPRRDRLDRPRARYTLDGLLILSYFLLQVGLAAATGSGGWLGWVPGAMFGIVIPGLVFYWMIGFVIYFNHTHPEAPWFEKEEEWSFFQGNVLGTVRLTFPRWAYFFTSNIMDHLAHHLDPRIPLVLLPEAQERIQAMLPGDVIVQAWSFAAFRDILARCKLYDYDAHVWTDYDGRPTSAPNFPRGSAALTAR